MYRGRRLTRVAGLLPVAVPFYGMAGARSGGNPASVGNRRLHVANPLRGFSRMAAIMLGLSKRSAVDTLQLRGIDVRRFVKRLGRLPMDEIAAAVAECGGVV